MNLCREAAETSVTNFAIGPEFSKKLLDELAAILLFFAQPAASRSTQAVKNKTSLRFMEVALWMFLTLTLGIYHGAKGCFQMKLIADQRSWPAVSGGTART